MADTMRARTYDREPLNAINSQADSTIRRHWEFRYPSALHRRVTIATPVARFSARHFD